MSKWQIDFNSAIIERYWQNYYKLIYWNILNARKIILNVEKKTNDLITNNILKGINSLIFLIH